MLLAGSLFCLTYFFLVWDRWPRVAIALIGASLVMLCGLLTQAEAFQAIDLNVVFLLVGMMIVVNIFKETGALDALGFHVARWAQGSGTKLMILLALSTACLSALLDNVTTVIILGSITCVLAKQLQFNPVPFLISQAMASNIGGTATLIGDPPNLMIGSAAHLSFNDFLIHVAPIICIILPIALWTLAHLYRSELQIPEARWQSISALSEVPEIKNKSLFWKALLIFCLILVGFFSHHRWHQEVGTIALAGASLLLLFENRKHIWDDVEWTTIFFFIGLFILVGAVEKVGLIHLLSQGLLNITQDNFQGLTLTILWLSGLASSIVDNVPYTATMIPMIQDLVPHYADITPLWWALSLGACLGGNATLIGAMANIMVVGMAERNNHAISFWEFTKVGTIIALESLLIASLYLWIRY